MPRIAHIADVHFRALSRHDEYREVFKAFAESCWDKGVEHIVVAGDIFHTKTTGISPEFIDELIGWVRTLTSVAPLHLTLGNHDGNLTNKNRQDAISPIVETLKNDSTLANPVYLYKQSGVYPIDAETNLCVFSLFDEEGYDRVVPEPGKQNIAVYHGPVATAVTETGWELESDVTIEKFRSFDVCMLGDIHRQQYLGYKRVNGELIPWIAYPGSTIQQNYAEDLNHGYLLWDVNTCGHHVEFVGLPNPRPFVTVDWTPDIATVKVPNKSRVRVRHTSQLSQADTRMTIEYFKNKFSATEVIFNKAKDNDTRVVSERAAQVRQNLHNLDTLVDLLKKHDKTNSMSADDWSEIRTTVAGYVSSLASSDADVARHVKWSIKDLKFDNILGYGEGSHVRFSDLNGIVGIFGPNRVGKSSIIAAITYCLFNSSDRGPLKNLQLVNVRKQHAYARAVISANNNDYVIERQTVRQQNKKDETGVTSVNLFRMEGDEAVDLNGEQRSDTDKMIRALIGTSDDFMMMSLSTQGDIDRFIREGSTHRKQVLTRFLDLDFMDQLLDSAKSDTNNLKAEVKLLSSGTSDDIQKIQENIDQVQSSIEELDFSRSSLASETLSHQRLIDSISSMAEGYRSRVEKQEKLEKVKAALEKLTSDSKLAKDEISSTEKKVKVLEDQLDSFDPDALSKVLDQVSKAKDLIHARQRQVDAGSSELSKAKKSIKVLQEVPCGDDYPTCKFIRDAHDDRSRLANLESDFFSAQESLTTAAEALKKLDEVQAREEHRRHQEAQASLRSLQKILAEQRSKLADIEAKIQTLLTGRDNLVEQIENLPEAPPDGYDQMTEKLMAFKSRLLDVERRHSAAVKDLGSLQEKMARTQESQAKLRSSLTRLKRHEFLSHAFSKKGIPASVLSEQLPIINQEITGILAGVVDFNIELECEPGSSSLEIYINYGDSRRAIELCSGMEKMIASLAIRVALTNVSTVPRSDIMVIDEGFGALDETNTDAVKRMLVSLKRYFKSILIISHVPAIKDVADVILEVRRNEKDSRINH